MQHPALRVDRRLGTSHHSNCRCYPSLGGGACPCPAHPRPLDPRNLPTPLTPLVGREREVAALSDLLHRADVRLLTLTGPGGVGKTRLALEVAADAGETFPDDVFFVSLAPITDSNLVLPTVAHVLGVREAGDEPLAERLTASLRDKHLLLVLDNFEQVVEAAPLVADLLKPAQTSRSWSRAGCDSASPASANTPCRRSRSWHQSIHPRSTRRWNQRRCGSLSSGRTR